MSHNIQTKDVLGLRSDDLDSHSWRKPAHHGLWHVGGDDAKTKPTQDYLRNKANKITTRFIVIADAKTKPTKFSQQINVRVIDIKPFQEQPCEFLSVWQLSKKQKINIQILS